MDPSITPNSPADMVSSKRQVSQSPWALARRRFFKNKVAVTSSVILLVIIIACAFAQQITGMTMKETGVIKMTQISKEPSSEFILGTDKSGREIYPRLLFAGQTSLKIAFSITLIVITIGTIVGAIAGYNGGIIDNLLMRFTDFIMVFPFIVLVIVVKSIFTESGVATLIFVIGFLSWTSTARIVRSKIMSEKENEYVLAAVSIGCRPFKVIAKHVLPNVLSTIIVQASLLLATMIVVETGLSYLGFGVPIEIPTWGNMVQAAKSPDVLNSKWWIWIPPAAVLTLTILCINFIGEGLKDAFNPKTAK